MKNTKFIFSFVFVLLTLGVLLYSTQKKQDLKSKEIMQTAMNVVRSKKPTPTQASFFYAQISERYYNEVYVESKISPEEFARDYSTSTMEAMLENIVKTDDENSLGFVFDRGPEIWNLTKGWDEVKKVPFSPKATLMPRFILDKSFTYQVPPPPDFLGKEFSESLAQVKEAASTRTLEQGAMVNFWGGIPGTEGPSGIWLNRLDYYSKNYKLSDKEYAYAQMILAQAIADSFMECWKVKYIYQTKRPDMVDKKITPILAMANPPFPSYVSGHSTISFTAATVLSALFPADRDKFIQDATNAKNSRLWAGIHFPHDNNEGQKLGVAVGEFIVSKLNLESIK